MLHPSRMLSENRYFIWGIARSGIHASAEWIYGSFPDHRLYLISQTYGKEPIASWENDSPLATVHDHGRRDNIVCSGRWPEDYQRPVSACVITLENHDLRCYEGDRWTANTLLGRSRRTWHVLLLRSLKNHYASYVTASHAHGGLICLIRGSRGELANLNTFPLDLWKMQAREYLGDSSYLHPKTVRLNYDAWHSSKNYRLKVSSCLSLSGDGEAFRDVPSNGGGSSFDKRDFDGHAEAMQVLDRWSRISQEDQGKLLDRLESDIELKELSNRFDAEVQELKNLE